jgi:hypothetical protein
MSPRLLIMTEIISPYRIPLFNTLAQRGDIDLHGGDRSGAAAMDGL